MVTGPEEDRDTSRLHWVFVGGKLCNGKLSWWQVVCTGGKLCVLMVSCAVNCKLFGCVVNCKLFGCAVNCKLFGCAVNCELYLRLSCKVPAVGRVIRTLQAVGCARCRLCCTLQTMM